MEFCWWFFLFLCNSFSFLFLVKVYKSLWHDNNYHDMNSVAKKKQINEIKINILTEFFGFN
jgi:hypothetical protein